MKALTNIKIILALILIINPFFLLQNNIMMGQSNHSLLFDGQSNYVEFPFADNHDLFEDFSIEIWVKFDSIPDGRILSKVIWDNPGDSISSYSLYFEESEPYKIIFSTLVGEFPYIEHKAISIIPTIYSQWNYIVVTYTEANYTKKIYINGALSFEEDNTGNIGYNGRPLFIGAFKTNQGDIIFPFKGNIDEVRIWQKALTAEEIYYNMNNPVNGNENYLVGIWHFNEGIGDTLYDSSTYNINGVINGASWDDGYINGGTYAVTTLTTNASAGSQVIEVASIAGFLIGDSIIVNLGGENEEINKIIGFGSLELETPLIYDHQAGETVLNLNPTSVDNEQKNILQEYTLYNNYPNPFNPTTIIGYQLPISSNVTLKVYDVLGNEITTLVNEEKPVGSYEVDFNAAGLSSGIYFYQLQAGDFISTKKMILLK